MKVSFEYGHGLMTAELPDSTDIFIPGETVPDPPYIPEDQIEAKPWNLSAIQWEWSRFPSWLIKAPRLPLFFRTV